MEPEASTTGVSSTEAFSLALDKLVARQAEFRAGTPGREAERALQRATEHYLARLRRGALGDPKLDFPAEVLAREERLLLPIVEQGLRHQLEESESLNLDEGVSPVPLPPSILLDEEPGPAAFGCADEILAYFAPHGLSLGEWSDSDYDEAHEAFLDFLGQNMESVERAPALSDLIDQLVTPCFPEHSADGYVSAYRSALAGYYVSADRYVSEFLVAVINADMFEHRAVIDSEDDERVHLRARFNNPTTLCGRRVKLGLRTRWQAAHRGAAAIAGRAERGPWAHTELCAACRASPEAAGVLGRDRRWVLTEKMHRRLMSENRRELFGFLAEAREHYVSIPDFEHDFYERTMRRALEATSRRALAALGTLEPQEATRAMLGDEYCDYADSVEERRKELPALPRELILEAFDRYHARATARDPEKVLPGPKREMNDIVYAWVSERLDIPEPEEARLRRGWGDQAMRLAYRAIYGEEPEASQDRHRHREMVLMEAALFAAVRDSAEAGIPNPTDEELITRAAVEIWGPRREEWPESVRRLSV